MTAIEYTILLAYLVQGIEVIFFPLPSDATTFALIRQHKRQGFYLKKFIQLIPFACLTAIAVLIFMAPLVLIIDPGIAESLHPVHQISAAGKDWLAVSLVTLGSVFTILAVYTLNRSRNQIEQNRFSLVDYNIYGWLRNPITFGLILILTGFCFAFPYWEMVFGTVIYIANAHIRIRMEEQQLEFTYGEIYLQYKQEVGRYFPRISQISSVITEPVD